MEKLLFVNEQNFTVKLKKKSGCILQSEKENASFSDFSLVSHPNMGGWEVKDSVFFFH